MSVLSSHGEVSENEDVFGEHVPTGLHIGMIRRELNIVQPLSAQQYEDDIKELKIQLTNKEKELKDLRNRVKDLEEKNGDLELQLERKGDEVNTLKERIKRLEDEKRILEEELSTVKVSLKNIERKLIKVNKSLKDVEKDLTDTKDQNQQLKVEIQQVRKEQRYVQGAPLRLPVPASGQQGAMMTLAEMACRILNAMYRKVLPDDYTPVINYTVAMIEKDINRLPKTEEERREATKRWEQLKTEYNWTEHTTEILHTLKESRNSMECRGQALNEQLLRRCTSYLDKENILKGWLNVEQISGLIDVWKSLHESSTVAVRKSKVI